MPLALVKPIIQTPVRTHPILKYTMKININNHTNDVSDVLFIFCNYWQSKKVGGVNAHTSGEVIGSFTYFLTAPRIPYH